MPIRVSGAEVREVIPTNLSDAAIDPFIVAASLMVDDGPAAVTDQPVPSSARLKEIERWLAAHLVAMGAEHTGRISVEDVDQVIRAHYGGDFGLYLDHTRYGQTAKMLDNTGALTEQVEMAAKLPAFIQVY